MKSDTISAVTTPRGVGGVSVIRISGEGSLDVLKRIFKPNKKTEDFEPYRMYPGLIDGGGFKDFGLAVFFKAPNSFTGEDMAELNCHGGLEITRGILENTFNLGCRAALAGEFTRRAFLNGKLELSSAEGLIDMINAESAGAIRAGFSLYKGKLFDRLREIRDNLKFILAKIDANIDFPEDGIEESCVGEIKDSLTGCLARIDGLIKSFKAGSKLKSGVKIAIAGRPNTGKSTLLNSILGMEKAIVTEIAGTTRDVIEGATEYNGVRYIFYDTAGIREGTTGVEAIGIERTKKMIESCDLVLMVLDYSEALSEEDLKILEFIKDKNSIIAANKNDLSRALDFSGIECELSAKKGDISEILSLIEKKTLGKIDPDAEYITQERHCNCLKRAKESIESALSAIYEMPLDILTVDIKEAWEALGEISGETASEEIIEEIFSKFCVGK